MTSQESSSVMQVAHLRDIPFHASTLVIADAALPRHVLDEVPEALLVEAGEQLKSLEAVGRLAAQVLARRSTRPLTLVALGGGSLGDAVGFLASILWRGVPLWYIPTTLLAMADSAHGGKTAVNLGSAKNQLGTFHPAERVYLVEDLLADMPLPLRREGLSEILKALMLSGDSRGFTATTVEHLTSAPYDAVSDLLRPLLVRAIDIKTAIVSRDPHERTGERTVLNLGHTVAHALEPHAMMPHGMAVAWGLATMLMISRRFGLTEDRATVLLDMLYPLLDPAGTELDAALLTATIERDKKRRDDRLRSVVLEAEGQPLVTDSIPAEEWIRTFLHVHETVLRQPVRAVLRDARRVTLEPDAGKSPLIRALIIAALRTGTTEIRGRSSADDVRHVAAALRVLDHPLRDTSFGYTLDPLAREEFQSSTERVLWCGDGAAPLRFLLAMACLSVRETVLLGSPALLARPHQPLLRALRSGGATIEDVATSSGRGWKVRGWERMPEVLSVEVDQSSQYASALALLAAGSPAPFMLRLLGTPVSGGYLEMTLDLLERAGVECIRSERVIAFNPTGRLREPCVLEADPDASSEAVWRTARYFEHPLRLVSDERRHAGTAPQPDARIDTLLDAIIAGQHAHEHADAGITLDCSATPDLVPLLAVAALRSRMPVVITGVAHARWKESDRLNGLAASLAALGIRCEASADRLLVHGGAAVGLEPGRFDTHGDHRLVMAGLLLSMLTGEITLTDPWSVTKSYPQFWRDARRAGWSVLPHREDGGAA